MKTTIKIQNLKCNGCATTITNKMEQIEDVSNVEVDILESLVTFEHLKEETLEIVRENLRTIGYPEEGDTNGLVTQAKSYVSCAIGKMS